MTQNRFATLDGLRGIAALAVLLQHASEFTLGITFPGASTAVDFFFLLSGFVLAHAYPTPGLSFLGARWIRLYPMCLFGTVLGAILMLSTGIGGDWPQALGFNLLGLPAPGAPYPFDGPLWSIAFEAVASVLYFLAARRLSLPLLALVLVGLALACPVDEPTWGGPGLIRALLPFAAGVLLHRLPRSALPERWALLSAAALTFFLSTGLLAPHPLLKTAIFAAIVAVGRAEPPEQLRKAALYLGRLSFPLYAVHWPVAWWMQAHGLHGLVWTVATCVISVALAHAVGRLYDEPLRRFLVRRWMTRPQLAPA